VAQLARLQLQLAKCEKERDELRGNAGQVAVSIIQEIIGLTTRLFGKQVTTYESRDPEFPEDSTVVFSVVAPLETHQILKAEQEWVRTVAKIAPKSSGKISLLVYPG
jgi:hypothetical protein